MRGFFCLLAVALAAVCLFSACTSSNTSNAIDSFQDPAMSGVDPTPAGAEIALVTNESLLESTFGQGVWNAINHFAGEEGVTCAVYKAEEDNADAAQTTLELAVRGGARLLFAMGPSVANTAAEVQMRYSEVNFVLLGADEDVFLRANSVAFKFSATQPGWLSGYLAVSEAAGSPVCVVQTSSVRSQEYALSFLLGAERAAKDEGAEPGQVTVFSLTLTDDMDEETRSTLLKAAAAEGAALFFTADESLQEEALAAARAANARVLSLSLPLDTHPSVLTQVEYDARTMVQNILAEWRADQFPGEKVITGTLSNDNVILKAELARFENMGERSYNQAVSLFDNGLVGATLNALVKPGRDGTMPTPEDLRLTLLTLRTPGEEDPADDENGAPGEKSGAPANNGTDTVDSQSVADAA